MFIKIIPYIGLAVVNIPKAKYEISPLPLRNQTFYYDECPSQWKQKIWISNWKWVSVSDWSENSLQTGEFEYNHNKKTRIS